MYTQLQGETFCVTKWSGEIHDALWHTLNCVFQFWLTRHWSMLGTLPCYKALMLPNVDQTSRHILNTATKFEYKNMNVYLLWWLPEKLAFIKLLYVNAHKMWYSGLQCTGSLPYIWTWYIISCASIHHQFLCSPFHNWQSWLLHLNIGLT